MTQTTSDEGLLQAYRQGDMSAFDLLYQRYRQPLFIFLSRRGHTPGQTEDLFHDCWIKVINHQASDFSLEGFKPWLYTIARNASIDLFRKMSIRPIDDTASNNLEIIDHPIATDQIAEGEDCLKLMKSAVVALPSEQKDAFLLHHEGNLSLQEIADMLQVGKETVKSRLRYGMKRLKQLLEDCLP